jgi:hypothetical protein
MWYVMSNAGQCWNMQAGSYSTYTDIIDYRCDGAYTNEMFRIFTNNGNGLNFNTAGLYNWGESECVNNKSNSLASGDPQIMWSCNYSSGGWNELYVLHDDDTNGLHFEAVNGGGHGGSGMCVSGMGFSLNGDYVELAGCNYNDNQGWL